jgi:hypothetical protein
MGTLPVMDLVTDVVKLGVFQIPVTDNHTLPTKGHEKMDNDLRGNDCHAGHLKSCRNKKRLPYKVILII